MSLRNLVIGYILYILCVYQDWSRIVGDTMNERAEAVLLERVVGSSSDVCPWVPGDTVLPVLHTQGHKVYHYGDKGH